MNELPKRPIIDLSNAKVGDRVESHTRGWGTVYSVNKVHTHPIRVAFDNSLREQPGKYTLEGRYKTDDIFPDIIQHIHQPRKVLRACLISI